MQTAIQGFITSFNQLQTDMHTDTAITTSLTGSVSTSILSSDHEVGEVGGSQLQMARAPSRVGNPGVGGAVSSLDSLGIDFNGTTGQLEIADSGKLQQALTSSPSAVAAFFQTAKTGFETRSPEQHDRAEYP